MAQPFYIDSGDYITKYFVRIDPAPFVFFTIDDEDGTWSEKLPWGGAVVAQAVMFV